MKTFQTSLDITVTDTGIISPLEERMWPEQWRQGYRYGVYAHDCDNIPRLVAVAETQIELAHIACNMEKYRTPKQR